MSHELVGLDNNDGGYNHQSLGRFERVWEEESHSPGFLWWVATPEFRSSTESRLAGEKLAIKYGVFDEYMERCRNWDEIQQRVRDSIPVYRTPTIVPVAVQGPLRNITFEQGGTYGTLGSFIPPTDNG